MDDMDAILMISMYTSMLHEHVWMHNAHIINDMIENMLISRI